MMKFNAVLRALTLAFADADELRRTNTRLCDDNEHLRTTNERLQGRIDELLNRVPK